jgi:hypothetical protein
MRSAISSQMCGLCRWVVRGGGKFSFGVLLVGDAAALVGTAHSDEMSPGACPIRPSRRHERNRPTVSIKEVSATNPKSLDAPYRGQAVTRSRGPGRALHCRCARQRGSGRIGKAEVSCGRPGRFDRPGCSWMRQPAASSGTPCGPKTRYSNHHQYPIAPTPSLGEAGALAEMTGFNDRKRIRNSKYS